VNMSGHPLFFSVRSQWPMETAGRRQLTGFGHHCVESARDDGAAGELGLSRLHGGVCGPQPRPSVWFTATPWARRAEHQEKPAEALGHASCPFSLHSRTLSRAAVKMAYRRRASAIVEHVHGGFCGPFQDPMTKERFHKRHRGPFRRDRRRPCHQRAPSIAPHRHCPPIWGVDVAACRNGRPPAPRCADRERASPAGRRVSELGFSIMPAGIPAGSSMGAIATMPESRRIPLTANGQRPGLKNCRGRKVMPCR